MDFQVLGPLTVRHGGEPLRLGTPQQQLVLAMLAVRLSRPVSLDELTYELWGEHPPSSAVAKVRGYAAALRRLFASVDPDRNRVVRAGSGYRLVVDGATVDMHRFDECARLASRQLAAGDLPAAMSSFETALAHWRGTMLDGLPRGPLLAGQCAAVEQDRLAIVDDLADTYLRRGRAGQACALLWPQIRAEPLREPSYALLMRACYQLDGAAKALEVYERLRANLAEDLGTEPSMQLRRLHRELLGGDRSQRGAAGADIGASRATALASGPRPATNGSTATAPPVTDRPSVPRTLPPNIHDFTGRVPEIASIRDQLSQPRDSGPPLVSITGLGGIGKTALCTHIAYALREQYPDGQLYASLQGLAGANPVPARDLLGRFLRLLGVDGSAVPDSLDERAELYRHLLAGRRVLVVLDNAASDDQILPLIPGSDECAVLVNSRLRLGLSFATTLLELDPLDPIDSARLLGKLAGPDRADAEPAVIAEVADRCGHLPLALRVAGGRLAAKPHWSVRKLAELLRDERTRLAHLSHGHLDVRASIALSYADLSPPARRLFRLLGDLDLPEGSNWVSAASLDTPIPQAETLLEELFDAQLIFAAGTAPSGDPQYRLHDLVRLFARERSDIEQDGASLATARQPSYGAWLHRLEAAYDQLSRIDDSSAARAIAATTASRSESNGGRRAG